jgi:hypothetical protein
MDQTTNSSLSVLDLMSMKEVIDIACSRGTFKANEMQAVGELYNRLETFLSMIEEQAKAEASAELTKQGETQ